MSFCSSFTEDLPRTIHVTDAYSSQIPKRVSANYWHRKFNILILSIEANEEEQNKYVLRYICYIPQYFIGQLYL